MNWPYIKTLSSFRECLGLLPTAPNPAALLLFTFLTTGNVCVPDVTKQDNLGC